MKMFDEIVVLSLRNEYLWRGDLLKKESKKNKLSPGTGFLRGLGKNGGFQSIKELFRVSD